MLVITALVGVVILAGFLPIVTATQNASGESVTYENPLNHGNYYMRELKEGDVLEIVVTEGQNTTVNVNGTLVKTVDNGDIGPYHQILMSDVLTVWTTSPGSSGQYAYATSNVVNYTNASSKFTLTNDGFTIKIGDNPEGSLNVNPSWGYIVCNESQAEYYESIRNGQYDYYLKSDNDVVCSGVYTTGDNDTYYWYKDGVVYGGSYETTYTINKTLVAGTSDIYLGNITLNIGGEEFTPYRVMIPIEVTGHKTEGALYEIFGLLPLIVGVGLLLMICIEVFRRYY